MLPPTIVEDWVAGLVLSANVLCKSVLPSFVDEESIVLLATVLLSEDVREADVVVLSVEVLLCATGVLPGENALLADVLLSVVIESCVGVLVFPVDPLSEGSLPVLALAAMVLSNVKVLLPDSLVPLLPALPPFVVLTKIVL